MSLTAEQLARRRTGIGGSEIAAVVGQDPYRGPLDVWLAKSEGWEVEETPAMERGRFLEAGVAAWYAHRTGANLVETGTLVHPGRPVALCTPDRLARLDYRVGGRAIDVSIKVPGPYVRESWGERGTDDVPPAYLLQVQWELMVLSASGYDMEPRAHLAAPIDGDLRIYELTSDPELQGLLLEEAERFWRDFVAPKKPPPLDASPTCSEWLKRRFPRDSRPILEADTATEVLGLELWEACREVERVEQRKNILVNQMKEAIGDAGGVRGCFGRVTWKANKNGIRAFKPTWRKS